MTPFAFIFFRLCLKSDILCIEQSTSVQTNHIPSTNGLWPVAMAYVHREPDLRDVQGCLHTMLGKQVLPTRAEGFTTTQASLDCTSHIEACPWNRKIPSLQMFENPHARLCIAGKIIQVPKA